jgi:hypothetical protein
MQTNPQADHEARFDAAAPAFPVAGHLAAAASAYAERHRLSLIPLHGIGVAPDCTCLPEVPCSHRSCTCIDGAACAHPGKHPRIADWWRSAAYKPSTIRRWWTAWPDANVGVLTGRRSGLVVLDIDPRNGGDDALAELERCLERLPPTASSLTVGDGRHLLFRHPGGLPICSSANQLGPGLDVRADRGLIVAPPSLHLSGYEYAWDPARELGFVEIAPLPEWLRALLRDLDRRATVRVPFGLEAALDGVDEGFRNDTIFRIASNYRGREFAREDAVQAVLETARKCRPPCLKRRRSRQSTAPTACTARTPDALAHEVGSTPDALRGCLRDLARAGWIAVQTHPAGRLTIRLELRIHSARLVAVNRRNTEPNAWEL